MRDSPIASIANTLTPTIELGQSTVKVGQDERPKYTTPTAKMIKITPIAMRALIRISFASNGCSATRYYKLT